MDISDSNNNQNTEQKIIEAAEQEFLTKGFAGARTSVIAAKAGVTHAMFHYYFRTKEKIFEKIISQKIELLRSLIEKSMDGKDVDFEHKIKDIIDRHIDFIADNPDLPMFLVREVFSNPERIELLRNRFASFTPDLVKNLQDELDEGFKAGKYRETDAKMLLIDIISLNVFAFIAAPLFRVVIPEVLADDHEFRKRRKRENYDTIMRKIKV